jgi:hypothetical protein
MISAAASSLPAGSPSAMGSPKCIEPTVDLLDRHSTHPGRGELDRQRQAVKPADDTGHGLLGETDARPRGGRPLGEQLRRIARL